MQNHDDDYQQQAARFMFDLGGFPSKEQTTEDLFSELNRGTQPAGTPPADTEGQPSPPATAHGLQDTTTSAMFDADRRAEAAAAAPPAGNTETPETIPADWMQAASDARDHAAALVADVGDLPSAVQPLARALQERGIDPAEQLEFLHETAAIVAALAVGAPVPDLAARAEAINKAAKDLGLPDTVFG
ncbi:hypothetical protein BLJ79_12260 [Arthrobacter sp. UCD-GKA]|uniref:hypothetical protein n=1 Tax=Arthrobacter sp. UCD-GKA TaxID=1913576 RepID=UPI0008DCDDCB|nr:hypothetical protein [Arthrobacter sp. UCD-GKA]OIH84234.1 hypothetical protein BLJ79_12260 [Arthrobacter sp. UCD-GKA]